MTTLFFTVVKQSRRDMVVKIIDKVKDKSRDVGSTLFNFLYEVVLFPAVFLFDTLSPNVIISIDFLDFLNLCP